MLSSVDGTDLRRHANQVFSARRDISWINALKWLLTIDRIAGRARSDGAGKKGAPAAAHCRWQSRGETWDRRPIRGGHRNGDG
jgi:hypothetical protein